MHRAVADAALDEESVALASAVAALPPRGVRTTLGFLALQDGRPKHKALRWSELTPGLMGVRLRPFADAADRFEERGDTSDW